VLAGKEEVESRWSNNDFCYQSSLLATFQRIFAALARGVAQR
jgi:hypothetical protein